jgi:hypothetical protein
VNAWAVLWHSRNRLDGDSRHLIWDLRECGAYRLFRTRRECRAYIEESFGYIRERADLRREPHGWFMPQAVLVTIQVASLDRSGEPAQ